MGSQCTGAVNEGVGARFGVEFAEEKALYDKLVATGSCLPLGCVPCGPVQKGNMPKSTDEWVKLPVARRGGAGEIVLAVDGQRNDCCLFVIHENYLFQLVTHDSRAVQLDNHLDETGKSKRGAWAGERWLIRPDGRVQTLAALSKQKSRVLGWRDNTFALVEPSHAEAFSLDALKSFSFGAPPESDLKQELARYGALIAAGNCLTLTPIGWQEEALGAVTRAPGPPIWTPVWSAKDKTREYLSLPVRRGSATDALRLVMDGSRTACTLTLIDGICIFHLSASKNGKVELTNKIDLRTGSGWRNGGDSSWRVLSTGQVQTLHNVPESGESWLGWTGNNTLGLVGWGDPSALTFACGQGVVRGEGQGVVSGEGHTATAPAYV